MIEFFLANWGWFLLGAIVLGLIIVTKGAIIGDVLEGIVDAID